MIATYSPRSTPRETPARALDLLLAHLVDLRDVPNVDQHGAAAFPVLGGYTNFRRPVFRRHGRLWLKRSAANPRLSEDKSAQRQHEDRHPLARGLRGGRERPSTSRAIVQKEKRSRERQQGVQDLVGPRGRPGSPRLVCRTSPTRPDRSWRDSRGPRAGAIDPSDRRKEGVGRHAAATAGNRTSQPKAWQAPHRTAPPRRSRRQQRRERRRRLRRASRTCASVRRACSICASVIAWPAPIRCRAIAARSPCATGSAADSGSASAGHDQRAGGSRSAAPRSRRRCFAGETKTPTSRRERRSPSFAGGRGVRHGVRPSRSAEFPSATRRAGPGAPARSAGGAMSGIPSIFHALPVQDVGDRVVVRGDGLAVDRPALAAPRLRVGELVWICETSKEVVMPLSYFFRAASRLRSASSRPLPAATIWRRGLDRPVRVAHVDDDVLLERRQQGLVGLEVELGHAPLPLGRAVEDRVREHEADAPVAEVWVKSRARRRRRSRCRC